MTGRVVLKITGNLLVAHPVKEVPAAIVFTRMRGAKPTIFAQAIGRLGRPVHPLAVAALPLACPFTGTRALLRARFHPYPIYVARKSHYI